MGKYEADNILEIKEDERKRILRVLKEREMKYRMNLYQEEFFEPLSLDSSVYEILQLVTNQAKNYPISIKRQLEKVGGSILG